MENNKDIISIDTIINKIIENQDIVNYPKHYTTGNIECIDYIYITRAGHKDKTKTIQDLKKAIWYIIREISRLSKLEKH